ncbi:hypothetical protein [Natronobiforma cellulositropha]|uniref:hypothetical protein n=1 Tax=Natronobiforma cellulositropha TaxID=1679076 RepID=UPI0021D60C04|nr:hypothetical protein [Natronobiforma cellulositropha]
MSTTTLRDASVRVRQAIVASILLYFALIIYAGTANDVTARIAADILFGLVAIGIGGLLFRGSRQDFSALTAAGLCLVVGGLAQLAWVALDDVVLDLASTVAVFTGVLLYIYAIWIAE